MMAQSAEIDALLQGLKSTYSRLQGNVKLSALVTRRVSRGEINKETQRAYELIAFNNTLQIRVGQEKKSSVIRVLSGGEKLLLISSADKLYGEADFNDPSGASFKEKMAELNERLWGRLLTLDPSQARSMSLLRDAELTVGGGKQLMKRLELKSKNSNLILYIDPSTFLVRKLVSRSQSAAAESVDEEITWLSVGSSVSPMDAVYDLREVVGFRKLQPFRDNLPY